MASRYILDGQSFKIASKCFPRKRGLRFTGNLLLISRIDPRERHAREGRRFPSLYWGMQFGLGALLPVAFWRLGADNFPAAVPLIVLLSFIFLTDLEAFIIPNHGSLGGTMLGLVFAVLEIPGSPNLRQALLGGLCGLALIYSINAFYHLWRGRDGIGFGDVKLMAMLGYGMTFAGAKHHSLGLIKLPFGCLLVIASTAWLLLLHF